MRIFFIGFCALVNTYPHETALTKRILYVVYANIQICVRNKFMHLCGEIRIHYADLKKKICAMRLYKICGRNKYMRFCGLYEIRIHYADWENMCAMRLCKICAQCAYVKYAQCAYISAYPQETA